MKHRNYIKLLVIFLALATVSLAGNANATIYSLYSDWSNTSNPNPPWEYLQGTTVLPHQYGGVSFLFTTAQDYFAPGNAPGNFLPAWFQDTTISAIVTHSVDSSNGNPSLGLDTLTWTSPVAGTISVSGKLWYNFATTTTRANDYYFYLGTNPTPIAQGVVGFNNWNSQADALDLSTVAALQNLSVSAGEVLSLVFQAIYDPTYNPDTFGSEDAMTLTITETPKVVPLPGAVWLLGSGLMGLSAVGWRRKKG